jgi:NAD+ dependent glucose-6-phosphate dehydrogenase
MRVLITGGCGTCGTALVALKHDCVFLDRVERAPELAGREFLQGDVRDAGLLAHALQGCEAVVHLVLARPQDDESWETVLVSNAELLACVLRAAAQHGVGRVVYASSNHAVGMYEKDGAPGIYRPGHKVIVDHRLPVRPDSLYGVSKAFGETLGRFYAENGGPRFYAIRIGSMFAAGSDHPYAAAEHGVTEGRWQRGSAAYERRVERTKGTWLSRRDFAHLVDCCLRYDGPRFDIFFGVSNNTRRWMDIDHAKTSLGYRPADDGELWTAPERRAETTT